MSGDLAFMFVLLCSMLYLGWQARGAYERAERARREASINSILTRVR